MSAEPPPTPKLRPPEWKRVFAGLGAALVAGVLFVYALMWQDRLGLRKVKDVNVVACHGVGTEAVAGYEIRNDSRYIHKYRIKFEARDRLNRRIGKVTHVMEVAAGQWVNGEARMTIVGEVADCVIMDVN
jgi:hypothetical protein